MKKIFTLFAAALLGLGAFAQDFDPTEGCQTWMSLYRTNSDAAKVEIEVQMKNLVNNLNSFDLLLQKSSDAMNWKNIKGTKKFSCEGYEAVILSELTEVDGEAIDDDGRAEMFNDFVDAKSSIKNGNLFITVVLKKDDASLNTGTWARQWPVFENPTAVGKFAVDMSGCADGEYKIWADRTPTDNSYSYLGVPHYVINPDSDDPVEITLVKTGDVIDAINTIETMKNVTSVKYYNVQGIESATPFDGVNIVVKTYEDGSKTTSKILR